MAAGELVLGHDTCGQLVTVAASELRGLAVWGDVGDYLSRLAAQLARQGWGVTYVGPTDRHPRVKAARPSQRQPPAQASGWLTMPT